MCAQCVCVCTVCLCVHCVFVCVCCVCVWFLLLLPIAYSIRFQKLAKQKLFFSYFGRQLVLFFASEMLLKETFPNSLHLFRAKLLAKENFCFFTHLVWNLLDFHFSCVLWYTMTLKELFGCLISAGNPECFVYLRLLVDIVQTDRWTSVRAVIVCPLLSQFLSVLFSVLSCLLIERFLGHPTINQDDNIFICLRSNRFC